MTDSFKIVSFPSAFKWLESSLSLLDQDEQEHSGFVGSIIYGMTLGFSVVAIPIDMVIGVVESIFEAFYHQDFSKALHVLKCKWVDGVFQETAFVIIGILSYFIERGDWQRSYQVTKYFVQRFSEYIGLGTPQIFNCIRYPIPKDGYPMPNSCHTQEERLLFHEFNTHWSKFCKNLRDFKENHERGSSNIYGVNNVIQRIREATKATDVMALNSDSLRLQDVKKRLEDERDNFASYSSLPPISDMLKVITSAHDTLQVYLNLPLHVRKEIPHP